MVESCLMNSVPIVNEEKLHETTENNASVFQTPAQIISAISTTSVLNKIHPLKNKWTLWFLNGQKNLDWVLRLKNVCTISNLEDFWALYDNIRPPSALPFCDYNLFKEGIEPMWEVPDNKNGGRLIVQVEKTKTELLDVLWLELLLSLIGEQYGDDLEQICGAVCNIRQKGSKISLWTKNSQDNECNKRIGTVMKNRLMAQASGANLRVVYEDHAEVQNKQSSAINCRFFI